MKGARFLCLVLLAIPVILVVAERAGAQSQKALLLFGGDDHKTFLGCLNCSSMSDTSVCNGFGKFGSSFETNSIWNSFGDYGSSFSAKSPWNSFSDKAPIIVDADGKSYGYFSVNSFHHDRTKIDWIVALLTYAEKVDDLDKTRDKLCGD
jgi:hypothetical protein